MPITLKLITDNENAIHFQELQRRVWMSPEDDLVPLHVSITVARNGGALLGAFADDGPSETGTMVGAALWWLGTDQKIGTTPDSASGKWPNPIKVCSHMAGVLPEWQGHGIGRQLKLAQREYVLQQGITDRITWTYDPLFVANSVFNLNRLGAVCTTYYPDYYGEMRDGLNAGMPSDRCQVDWLLTSQRVIDAASGNSREKESNAAAPTKLPSRITVAGFNVPLEADKIVNDAIANQDPIAVPLPNDIVAIRNTDRELALTWRLYVRETLQSAFAKGYTMVDCINIEAEHYYILESNSHLLDK